MRTFRGIPECNLPLGRRFTTIITHTCDDEDDPYVETTFVDVAPGRIDVLLRPHADLRRTRGQSPRLCYIKTAWPHLVPRALVGGEREFPIHVVPPVG
jgi:hypothetical protein